MQLWMAYEFIYMIDTLGNLLITLDLILHSLSQIYNDIKKLTLSVFQFTENPSFMVSQFKISIQQDYKFWGPLLFTRQHYTY